MPNRLLFRRSKRLACVPLILLGVSFKDRSSVNLGWSKDKIAVKIGERRSNAKDYIMYTLSTEEDGRLNSLMCPVWIEMGTSSASNS